MVPALIASAGLVVIVRCSVLLMRDAAARPASADRDPVATVRLGLGLIWGWFLSIIGSQLTFFANPDHARHLNPAARWTGMALLLAGLGLAFVVLVRTPSTRRELARLIDLEAAAVALGLVLFLTLTYQGWQHALGLPEWNQYIALITILASYLVAKFAIRFRYR